MTRAFKIIGSSQILIGGMRENVGKSRRLALISHAFALAKLRMRKSVRLGAREKVGMGRAIRFRVLARCKVRLRRLDLWPARNLRCAPKGLPRLILGHRPRQRFFRSFALAPDVLRALE